MPTVATVWFRPAPFAASRGETLAEPIQKLPFEQRYDFSEDIYHFKTHNSRIVEFAASHLIAIGITRGFRGPNFDAVSHPHNVLDAQGPSSKNEEKVSDDASRRALTWLSWPKTAYRTSNMEHILCASPTSKYEQRLRDLIRSHSHKSHHIRMLSKNNNRSHVAPRVSAS